MFRWDCTVSPILWRGYAVKPKPLRIFNARSQWCKNGKKYLRINETRQTGAVGNRGWKPKLPGWSECSAVGNRNYRRTKDNPPAPLIRNETRQTGAVGNRTYRGGVNSTVGNRKLPGWSECSTVGNRNYRGGVNAARLETETTAGRKTTPLAPLIRGKVRKLHLPDPINRDRNRGAKVSICFWYSP